jgi:hypothetical protein
MVSASWSSVVSTKKTFFASTITLAGKDIHNFSTSIDHRCFLFYTNNTPAPLQVDPEHHPTNVSRRCRPWEEETGLPLTDVV